MWRKRKRRKSPVNNRCCDTVSPDYHERKRGQGMGTAVPIDSIKKSHNMKIGYSASLLPTIQSLVTPFISSDLPLPPQAQILRNRWEPSSSQVPDRMWRSSDPKCLQTSYRWSLALALLEWIPYIVPQIATNGAVQLLTPFGIARSHSVWNQPQGQWRVVVRTPYLAVTRQNILSETLGAATTRAWEEIGNAYTAIYRQTRSTIPSTHAACWAAAARQSFFAATLVTQE